MTTNLEQFAENVRQEVLTLVQSEDDEAFREDMFTKTVTGYLSDYGEIDEAEPCSHRARGIRVSGYTFSENEETLDLFVSIYKGQVPPVSIPRSEIDLEFARLKEFFIKSINGYHEKLEEASEVFDLALRIYELKNSLISVRYFVITDGLSKIENIADTVENGIKASYHIWDIERFCRLWNSGKKREIVEIDFKKEFGQEIPCLLMPKENDDYTTYLAIMPAILLSAIYDKYGPRLLEKNVRSFLQVRTKVNKGIRETILSEPKMFLAYNNGIAVTADKVALIKVNGGMAITAATDFQIVNGGQTTASLFNAVRKDNADISDVFVQVKFTIIKKPEISNDLVSKISLYANSQNKVNTADFSANDPFHIKLEEFSRTIWAPAAPGVQHQTHWFYERARGQYLDEKGRQTTPARKRSFEAQNPSKQKFTKTDLAKFEHTWMQMPHYVSRGAEKNFKEFAVRLGERGKFTPDEQYFKHLAAKALLFRRAEGLIQQQQYGGYRANIVTYTLAYMSKKTNQRIDLDQIWREQSIPKYIEEAIINISKMVHDFITNPTGGRNITEWCKKEECWKSLCEKDYGFSQQFESNLIDISADGYKKDDGFSSADADDMLNIATVREVSGSDWLMISRWGKETGALGGFERKLAYSIGKWISNGQKPTRKMAKQGIKILEKIRELGFKI